MNIRLSKLTKLSALFFVAIFFSFCFHKYAEAATRTWTGTTSGSWSVASNWGGTAPVTGDDLVFPAGASNLSNTNDFTENTIFNSITISGSGYTLSGNPIILGPGLAGLTDSTSSGGNTIALDIRLDVTRDIVVTNAAETLTISGRIAGVGGINKEGLGTLLLSGANTYGGTTKINVGVINAQSNTALGSVALGTEVVGGAALELQGNISIGYEALALRGYGVATAGALRNISGTNTFGGVITLSSAAGTEIASDAGTLTLAGGVTGTFPLIFDGAGNITCTTTPIANGSSTVTKNGAGTLRYNFPNTYTGLTTVNAGALLYGVDNAILSGGITVTGGTLDIATYSDMVGTVTLGTLDLASGTITGTTGMLSSATWTVYNGTISAIIAGDGGALTKSTPGTVVLTRANEYTGATTISAGILEIQDSNGLGFIDGTTTVTAGATLQIDGSGLSIPEYITFSGTGYLYTGAIRNTTGNNTLTGLLTLGAAASIKADTGTTLTIDSKGISVTTLGLVIAGAGNVTFTETAPIYGTTATLTKNDTGVLTIKGFSNFTGATNLGRGEVVLSSAGAIPNSTITVGSGGTLTLDNSSTSVLNRVSDSAAFTMNGGTLNFIGSSSSGSFETIGALTPASGHNIVTVTPGAGGPTILTAASLSRTAGASILFRGTDFGLNPAANVSTLMFTTAPTLTGGGGAANSTTISVIKGGFGDTSLSGAGSDMVTYNIGNANGLRLLNGAGFSGEYATNLATTNANVKLTADAAASTVSINSLILDGFSITNPGSAATVTMASASLSGNILVDSATSIAGANTTLGITTNELVVLATANATISAVVGTAVAGSLTLSGTGNVTLSTAGAYTGTTSINTATLTYGASNVISSGGVTVVGGTYDLGNFSDTVGAVTLQNGTITSGSGILTGTSYSFREGTVSAIIAGSVGVTRIATSAAADSVVIMTRNNTYTGVTTITSGILKLGAAGDGTNTPLGTTGGGTTIANIAALDLNGFTLSTAEAITSMSGLGYGLGSSVANGNSNRGALMNSSATPVSYSGAITLAAASRINADYGALTVSSAVSGAFGLTIGGFSDSTFSGVIGIGSGTLTKDGIGVLTLSNSNTYTGATTISVGTIKLGATGGATNTPLGTTGGATTVSTGARLDLNGFTLGTAEPLTLNGVGYGIGNGASGALINSSGSSVTYSGVITLGSTGVLIKANSGNINLTGASIGGNTFGLILGGTGTGTISNVIGTTSGTVTKIDTGTWTLSASASTYTGATNIYLGTLKLGATGGATNTPLGTTGSGTTIYSGAVLDFNGFTVGTAEALTINGRGINDGGAVIGANVTFAGTIAQATDSRITNASGTFTISGAVTGAFNIIVSGAGNTTFSAATGTAGLSLTKQGAGTLTITGTNTHTGATRVEAGTLAYAGTTTMAATPLTVLGGTFNNGANADTIGTVTLIGGTITNSAALTAATSYTLESGTISGIIAGAIPVTKNTNNTVTLTGANTISSTVTVNAGTLTFSGNGTATSVTGFTVNLGGTLSLDNSSTAVASRIGDAIVITMNGGNFNFSGNTAGTASETIGQFAFASGHNTVTVTPGAGGSTTLTVANNPGFNRSAGATVLFRGTSFGSTPAANVSTLMFSTAPTLTGGGGAASSTTLDIIKGAFGDSSLSGTGTDMVTYNKGNTNGLRLLNGAGFSGEYATNLATTNANVKLTADAAASTVTTNSIILNGFSITNPGSAQTITLSTTGNILANSATSIAGANTTLGISTSELAVLATANATISAVIGTATTGSLTLSGSGNVTLSGANAYTGTTTINGATLTYGASNVLSSGGVTVVGGTYNLNGNSDTVGALSLNAGTMATGAGTLTTSTGGVTTIANNNVASFITGNLTLGAGGTFNIGNGLMDNDAVISAVIGGAQTLTKSTGTGVLELSGSNTYSGATTISAGAIRLGAAGDATNTPLGTTAGGTTVSGASSALDLNGFTLGTSEALTLSGAPATGALQNTSSTAVTYTGLITLGAASTIIANYGDINISNTGTITGATFGLTIGGAGNGTLSSILGTTSGTLTKNGLGTWTVSGSSTFTGTTTISAGVLKLGAAGGATNTPLGTTGGATSITSGATLDLNGYTLGTAEPITINGLGMASVGAFINSSNNTISYSGALTMGAASRIANRGTGMVTLSGAISGNFALTVVAVGDFTQATNSVWSGSGSLIKEGSGTLTLSGQNTMTGSMTVSTGKLQLGANGGATNTPFGTNAGGVTVSSGAVLDLSTFSLGGASTYETLNISGSGIKNGGAIISSASGSNNFGAMTIAANARVINSGSGTITFGGTITAANGINFGVGGTGPITVSGVYGATATSATITKWYSGTLTISAASITTGLVRVNGGTLTYGVANALSTPALTIAGGTVNLNGFNETNIGAVTLIDGSIVNTGGAATLTSTATYTLENGTVSAVLGGTVVAAIAKNTAGRVILSGDNTFSGTSATIAVNAGYLNLRHNNALGAAASANTTTILGGATLELENGITIPNTKAITANGTGVNNSGAIRNVNGTNSIGANITLGTTNVRVNSDSGTLTIPTVSGNTFNLIVGGAGNTTVSGAIGTTSGSVTKDGAGTFTPAGTNTYTGPTTIVLGTLAAGATASIGNGSATNTLILRGGTLQATGTITSPGTRTVSLASSGTFDTNGNSVSIAGAVTSAGTFTKAGSGTLTISGATTLYGDLVVSGGTLAPTAVTFAGTEDQDIDGFTGTGAISMTKLAGTATLGGAVTATGLTINGTGGTLDLGSSLTHNLSGDVTLTAGTLDGGSSTLNLSSTSATVWNGTGTLFNPGTSTVVFNGGNQTLAASDMVFNNLTFDGSGTKTLGGALTVNGNLTNNAGNGATYATWNPSDKSTHITLSNGNLTATNDGGSNNQARATIGKSSGKWYWELSFTRTGDTAYPYFVPFGLSKTTESAEVYPGATADGLCISTDGDKWTNGANTAYTTAWSNSDIIGVALDMDAGSVVLYRNGVSLGTLFSGLSGTYYPATGSSFGTGYTTANFGATAFTYAPPDGYNAGVYTGSTGITIATGNNPIILKGNFVNSGNLLDAGNSNITVDGVNTQTIAGFTTTGAVSVTKTGGAVTFGDNITASSISFPGATATVNLGSNIFTLSGTGTVWDMASSTSVTVNPGSSTIKLTNSSSSGKTFAGGGKTYNNFWFAPGSGSGSLTISGNNTFNDFRDDGSAAHSILFTTGSTQTLSSWSVSGSSGQLITINSTDTGTHNLVKVGGGSVIADYLNIQHSVVQHGLWFAGTNSVNNQNIASAGSGWIFQAEIVYRSGGSGAGGEVQSGGGDSTGGGGQGGGGGAGGEGSGGGGGQGGGGGGGGGDSE